MSARNTGKNKEKPPVNKQADNVITSVLDAPPPKEVEISEEDLYETDPELVDNDIIVNVVDSPQLLPKGDHRNSTIRLLRGDRVKGKWYKDMVKKHHVPGIQLCCKLEKSYLEELEKARQERTGEKPAKWIQEAWALKEKG